MDLGAKLKAARLEAGLSQRQLCGDAITRNMLSQIENGAARPSMDTLRFLAARLGKPLSWFLEEDAVTSPNLETMKNARSAFEAGQWQSVLDALADFREPDPDFSREAGYLRYISLLRLGEQALREGRLPYARSLLTQAGTLNCPYIPAETEAHRAILLHRAGEDGALPDCDALLRLRARKALRENRPERCLTLLNACESREEEWNLLAGLAHFERGDHSAAIPCLEGAEKAYPKETIPKLEAAYRDLGDYKKAYEYACKARSQL